MRSLAVARTAADARCARRTPSGTAWYHRVACKFHRLEHDYGYVLAGSERTVPAQGKAGQCGTDAAARMEFGQRATD
jgi:hypothetical protein